MLHRLEARPALLVESADLTVDDAVRCPERPRQRTPDGREPLRQVVPGPAPELCLTPGEPADGSVPVPLDLVDPTLPAWDGVRQGREHRLVPTVSMVLRRGGVSLPEQQPVLGIAIEVRRNKRPDPLEALAVQSDGQPSVALLLEKLIRAPIPELDGPCAVLTLRYLTFEVRVGEWMVIDVDSQTPIAGLEWNALRHRPAGKGTVTLKPKVIVEPARAVSLHDEDGVSRSRSVVERLRSTCRMALSAVLVETTHRSRHRRLPDRVAIVTS